MLLDPETHELLIRGAVGLDHDIIKQTRVKLGDQIAGLVAKEDQPLLVTDIETDFHVARANRSHYRSKSFISVPIKIHNRLEGVVNVADKNSKESDVFTEIDLKILNAIVRQAAIAIENANYYRKLEHLSTTDSLTTLFNHRYFLLTLDREIDRLKRYPKPLCLLMLDIDDFKMYNDTYGHLAGDSLLKDLSALLKDNLRNVDIICRYAGDEFVAILPETDVREAEIIAHKLKNALIQQRFRKKVTISIGIAKCGTDMSRRDLIMKADQALYQSKRGGRNRICCFY
jgi:diguanylate cyclase (GGDEF)-like protein